MPQLTQLFNGNVQVTITEQEVMEARAEENNSPTVGQTIQNIITHTMGWEREDQYWLSDIKDAVDASFCELTRAWKYVYKVNDDSDLVF
jgi:hypothetical protein